MFQAREVNDTLALNTLGANTLSAMRIFCLWQSTLP